MELSDDEHDRVLNNFDSDNDGGDRADEAEEEPSGEKNGGEEDEETKRRVDPSTSRKRIVRNPVPKLDAERLQGPKGIQTIEKSFEGFKFHGKGHERSDLNTVMKRLEYWAHRLFPKYGFDDFIEKMETLGNKKNIQVLVKKYRLGMLETIERRDTANGEEVERGEREEEYAEARPIDEFDQLIAEQIEKQREPVVKSPAVQTPSQGNVLGSASSIKPSELSDEIKARIETNRKLAFERKMARIKRQEEEREKEKLEKARKSSQMAKIQEQIRQQVPPHDNANISELLNETPTTTESLAESWPTNDEIEVDTEIPRTQDMEKPKRPKFKDSPPRSDPRSSTSMPMKRKEPFELKLITFDRADGASSMPLGSEARLMEKTPEGIEERLNHTLPEPVDVMEVSEATETPKSPDKPWVNNAMREKENRREIAMEPEKMLTEEELMREIDNAMEEIINNRSIVL